MKIVRKKNPLLFDLALFLAFCGAAFSAYVLTEAAGAAGALVSLLVLALISVVLIVSR